VNFTGDIILTPQCLDSTTAETVGGLAGVKIITASTTDPNSAEYKLFAAVMKTYTPESELGGEVPDGFQAVVGFARAVARLSGEVTSQTVANALRTMPSTPMPLGDGVTFKCDGQQVPVAPNICSTQVLTGTLDDNGKINGGGYSVLDVSGLMKAR
jgi:branched-chain amino acid transport system substrate-binding protein